MGYIRFRLILGFYRDNGKQKVNYYIIMAYMGMNNIGPNAESQEAHKYRYEEVFQITKITPEFMLKWPLLLQCHLADMGPSPKPRQIQPRVGPSGPC